MELCESPRIPFKVLYERFETGKILYQAEQLMTKIDVYSSKL